MPVWSRRQLLLGAVAIPALAACERSRPTSPRPDKPDADTLARRAAAAIELRAVDAYDEALAGTATMDRELMPLREHHVTQAALLIGATTATPSPTATAVPPAAQPVLARRRLAAVEIDLRDQHLMALRSASPALAGMLASLAAAAAAHHAALVGS